MIILSIGSNLESVLGNRFQNIKKTIELLRLNDIEIIKISNFYETPSYPNNKYPKFINIALSIQYKKSPKDLLNDIWIIEKKMGRIRNIKNEPRICDIDIIDFDGLVINNKEIKLPHPEAYKRNFVLFPLREIFPMWIHPLNNIKIEDLINKLDPKSRNEITRSKESAILAL
jgi:2-amino-4-hydroxy-6-hydroxymethyldihydropteridine diphosphokinase